MMTDLTDPSWGDPPWPEWLTGLRPHQVSAIDDVTTAFTRTPVVILDAPTGAGKTVIAEGVRRRLGNVRGIYTCTTKTLQDQFLADFDYSRVLKGRANYPTELGHSEVNCADCTWDGNSCMWCDGKHTCPYEGAKRGALTARVAVLNTAYFLTEANGPGRFGGDNARPLVVLDEADELESALMGWVSVEVGPYWQRRLNIKPPNTRTAEAKSNDWKQWAEHALERATAELERTPPSTDLQRNRDRQRLWNLCSRLAGLVDGIDDGAWVYDGYQPRRGRQPTIVFKPVMVDTIAGGALWRHGQRFLLMSGSVISAQEMADSLGIDDYELVRVPVQWDASQRPIYYTPVANVVHKEKATAYPKLAARLGEILFKHPVERILVHTVSYDLARYLKEHTEVNEPRDVFTYTNAGEREEALAKYRASEAAVLIAPSMDRGVDLKDDDCRVQVVCKIPYPNLGDKQVSKRAHMGRRGKTWYAVQVVRTFVQMVGRGMRHEDDHVVTYVLDEQFERAVLKRRQLVPAHVWEAVVK